MMPASEKSQESKVFIPLSTVLPPPPAFHKASKCPFRLMKNPLLSSVFGALTGIATAYLALRILVATTDIGPDAMDWKLASGGSRWDRFWKWHRIDRSLSDVCPFPNEPPPPGFFLENRPKLYNYLYDVLESEGFDLKKKDGDEFLRILLPTPARPIRDGSDAEFEGWKQNPNVQYLVGQLPISSALFTLTPIPVNRTFHLTLYLPSQTDREAVFTGVLPSAAYLRENHGIDEVKGSHERSSLCDCSSSFLTLDGSNPLSFCTDKCVKVKQSVDIATAFAKARFVKTETELGLLQKAGLLAAWAHERARLYLAHARVANEAEVARQFARDTAVCGGFLQAYSPIVGASPHGAILHYRTGENLTASYAPIPHLTPVLIDAAPEFHGYASDVTRTPVRYGPPPKSALSWPRFPHPKVPSPPWQVLEVYGIVDRVQKYAVDELYEEGKYWGRDVVVKTLERLTRELAENGFLVGDVDELIKVGAVGVFMPHGLGHSVGIEVHDPTPAPPASSLKSLPNDTVNFLSAAPASHTWPSQSFANSRSFDVTPLSDLLANDFVIPRGHVVTVEPGVYFIPYLLDQVKRDPERKGWVNWEKVEGGKYAEVVGGVRIEDVVAIGAGGGKRIFTRI
ncbi:hypothetical protein HDU97_001439 [Phlyctochytrium planicorne]|nr:hypothetical protein HDU97_001439 [Phlyctochytrium planicorne]